MDYSVSNTLTYTWGLRMFEIVSTLFGDMKYKMAAKYQSVCSKRLIYCKHYHLAIISKFIIQLQLRDLAAPGLLYISKIIKYIYLISNFGRNILVYIYVHKCKILHIYEYYFV